MKKELLIASLFAASLVGAAEITSNEMSIVPLSGAPSATVDSKNLYMVVAPFTGYTGSDSSIAVADVIQTANLSEGDVLYIRVSGGTYNSWTLNASKTWDAASQVIISVSGTKTTSGTSPSTPTIARGQAFWVKTAATQVNLFGQAITEKSAVAVSLSTGWNMVGSTIPTGSVKLSTFSAAGSGDIILLADGTRYQKGSSAWKKYNNGKWAAVDSSEAVASAGVAFWFYSKAGGESFTF